MMINFLFESKILEVGTMSYLFDIFFHNIWQKA